MTPWVDAAGSGVSAGPVLGALAAITTALTALFLIGKGLRSVWRTLRRANETIDHLQEIIREWRGEQPSNGDPGRPSVPVRMANIERSLALHLQHHPGSQQRPGQPRRN